MDVRAPPQPFEFWAANFSNPVVAFGRALVFESGNDPVRIALWSRLPIVLLGAALVAGVFLWGRRLFGAQAAVVGAALAALCPNLIAHAGLATEDLGCSALMFFATWTLWLAYREGGTWRWARAGVVTGLALLSKHTALVLGPSFVVIAAIAVAAGGRRTLREWIVGLLTVGAVAALLVGIAYGPQLGWPAYVRSLGAIYGDTNPGYSYYLAGTFSPEPRWYYTLAAFAFKVSAATIVLLALAAVTTLRGGERRDDLAFVLVPAAAVIAASFFDAANLGLRRILPAFPFLYLFASSVLNGVALRTRRAAAVAALLAFVAVETALIYPDHLSYFSVAAGRPGNAPNLLDDSNVDWGQDLPALAEWQLAHPGDVPMRILHVGNADPAAYGVAAVPITDLRGAARARARHVRDRRALAGPAARAAPEARAADRLVARFEPVGRAGRSIYLYRLGAGPSAASPARAPPQ